MGSSDDKLVRDETTFQRIRKKFLRLTLISFLLTFVSLAIVGTQLFYPFHVVIGVGLYILSFIPMLRRLYVSRDTWRSYKAYRKTTKFFKRERRRVILVSVCVAMAMVYFIVRPLGGELLKSLSDSDIQRLVSDDLYKSITALDYLESTGAELLDSLDTDVEDANVTEQIEDSFNDFLQAVMFSESLTEVHRHFNDIPYKLWDERVISFSLAYSLYVKKYELLHRVMVAVGDSEYKKKVLNQYITEYDQNNLYNEMIVRFYAPKTRIKISTGRVYLAMFGDIETDQQRDAYTVLQVKAKEGHSYLLTNFDTTIFNSGTVAVDTTRIRMFDVWLPFQRGVANTMGRTILSTRGHEYLIESDLITDMNKVMQPGDIMLQRRNWHLSNVGIPGFWTHAAMYVGDIQEMDSYFASEFPYEGYEKMSDYLVAVHPEMYINFTTVDTDGNPRAVIEAIEPGVVLQSLEKSAHADFVATIRPKLSKHDKMLALFKAFSHFGKPYDYNFDFDTRDALVCSELVYDSYYERLPEKQGIHLDTSLVNGRKVVSPLDMAKKFKSEYGTAAAEYSFVYFIAGNEETKTAAVATESEFLASVDWNKFSFLQEK